ncbi:hypothetical protein, partial [Nostoc sp. 2RC]|uniref:hypothetical protein n=1 Tax=Nostoc sp. 2RC TaxID=2485484 RepID=UPI001C897D70
VKGKGGRGKGKGEVHAAYPNRIDGGVAQFCYPKMYQKLLNFDLLLSGKIRYIYAIFISFPRNH